MKLKHIALAVLAATSFGAAHAVVNTAGNNSEIVFVAYDKANQTKSYLFDTGVTVASLANGSINYSISLASDANWNSFLSAVGAANVGWYVEAFSATGGLNTSFLYATLGAGETVGGSVSNSVFKGAVSTLTTTLGAASVTAGTSEVNLSSEADYLGNLVDPAKNFDGLNGALSGVQSFSNTIGSTGVAFFGIASSNTAKLTLKTTALTTSSVAGLTAAGTLTIGAPVVVVVPSVPEPESYGLALVGLLLAGAVARRRAA